MLASGDYLPNPLQQLGGQFSQALQSTGPWGSTVATPTDGNMPVGNDNSLGAMAAQMTGNAANLPGAAPGSPPMSLGDLGNAAPVMADLTKATGGGALSALGGSSPISSASPGLAGMQGYSQLLAQQAGQLPALQQQQQSNRTALLQALNNLTQQQANYKPPSQINQPLMAMAAASLSSPNENTALGNMLGAYRNVSNQQAEQERDINNQMIENQAKIAGLPESWNEDDIKNAQDAEKLGVTAAEETARTNALLARAGVVPVSNLDGTPVTSTSSTAPLRTMDDLTAQERKVVTDNTAALQNIPEINNRLQKALALSTGGDMYSGALSPIETWVARNTPLLNAKTGANTTEFNNVLLGNMADTLKATFGSRITNTDLNFAKQLQGISTYDPLEQQTIIKDALDHFNNRADELRTVNDSILQGNLVQQTGSSGVIGKPLNAVSNTNIQGAGKQIAANAATPSADSIAQIQSDSDYNNLPSGTRFTGPDGKVRVKP